MSVFRYWLGRLRQMISNASQPEPVPDVQWYEPVEQLYSEEQVQTLCLEKIQEGKALAYEEMAGNAGNLYWWRRGKQQTTDALQRIDRTPKSPAEKWQMVRDEVITTEAYEHNQLPGFDPYTHQGKAFQEWPEMYDPRMRSTEITQSVAPPESFHRAHFEPFTTGHAAMPTEREDRFIL